MISAALIGGLLMGLAGSLHCAGMCGPLVFMLPIPNHSFIPKVTLIFLYHGGRIIIYSLGGLLAGLLGRSFLNAEFQQGISIVAGSAMILFSMFYFKKNYQLKVPVLKYWYHRIQARIVHLLRTPLSGFSAFALGMANALLPCGWVYMALLSSLAFIRPEESTLFMAMFGAGTLPLMLMISLAGALIKPELKLNLKKIAPVAISLVGVLLILRGLNLGIPFLSPHIPVAGEEVQHCTP
ncbi:MAG: sulfite exporter TauE/SafE family protein [Chitinophagaceae bacterium]|nr:sulfite exporter TauE/SafE family protein [Chitinophagaceae bacterium]